MRWLASALVAVASLSACAAEWEEPTLDNREAAGSADLIEESVAFAPRFTGEGSGRVEQRYGLPVGDGSGVADLLDLIGSASTDFLVASGDEPAGDVCSSIAVSPRLPMTITGVVSLASQKYLKVPVCGQDERFYASFVVEDDTGGIVVLRDGRVSEFDFGDHVRLTVRGLIEPYAGQKYVVISDTEKLEGSSEVRYTPSDVAFSDADLGRTMRVSGFVLQEPTSSNFNAMVVSNRPLPEAGVGESTAVCRENCAGTCRAKCPSDTANTLCVDRICPAACAGGASFNVDLLPTACWNVSLEQELGRRGVKVLLGSRISVTAPVVSGFGGLQQWVVRTGQIETVSE